MRRLSGMVVAGALLVLPAFAMNGHAQEAPAQAATPPKTTYNADAVIVMYAVNPGKDADYEQVSRFTWYTRVKKSGAIYVFTTIRPNGKPTTLYMHRMLLNSAKGDIVDHKDGNPLNNQRSNLRV